MTEQQQNEVLEKSYDWIARVCQKQERFIGFNDLWSAYPYKTTGLTKKGLMSLYSTAIDLCNKKAKYLIFLRGNSITALSVDSKMERAYLLVK